MDKEVEKFEEALDPRYKGGYKGERFSGALPPEASSHPTVMERRRSREMPRPHFKRLAETWSGMIGHQITPAQCCLMLAALKMVREWYMHDDDNVTDATGYLSMVDEVRPQPQPPEHDGCGKATL